ncbi:unnamed protein product, partial [marine sediment metagenome]
IYRTSLRAGVLTTLANNQKHEEADIRLFEIGKIFLPQYPSAIALSQNAESGEGEVKQSPQDKEGLPHEKEMLCAVLSGSRRELSWHDNKELLDFFDAKGVAERLLEQLGLTSTFEPSDDEGLLLGRRADVIIGGDKVGVVGNLHSKVAQGFELSGLVCLIEMDVEKLMNKASGAKRYQPIPRFPSITRDIALVINEQVTFQETEAIIQSFPLVEKNH